MDLGFKGKTAVVLGGSKGIGRAVAETFLKEGAKVAICARKEDELKAAYEEMKGLGEVYWEVLDVTDEAGVYAFADHVAEKLGGIDAWVNNVGATVFKDGDEFTGKDIDFKGV